MALSITANDNMVSCVWEFKLNGEIDISNAQYFKQQVDTALAEKRQSISIDLSDLSYIDSTGLGVIIGVYSSIKKDGLTIKVFNPRDNVKKLLNISGLDRIFC